jgi:hypothetical protein
MDVVRHEAVTGDSRAMQRRLPPQDFQIEPPVISRKKHRLPVVPALRNMMGNARHNPARTSRHTCT